jgi:hypothetical protein
MIHHRALRAISARSRRLRRQHHRALSSPPAESNNDREELLRCIPSVYSQRCRARSGSEASPSFRRLPLKGVWRSRGFHASTRTRLIEDRDGRGLTEEIIEENLVGFFTFSFSRSLFVIVRSRARARVCSNLALETHTLSLSTSPSSRTKKRRTENEAKR